MRWWAGHPFPPLPPHRPHTNPLPSLIPKSNPKGETLYATQASIQEDFLEKGAFSTQLYQPLSLHGWLVLSKLPPPPLFPLQSSEVSSVSPHHCHCPPPRPPTPPAFSSRMQAAVKGMASSPSIPAP